MQILIGVLVTLLGFLISLFSLTLTSSLGGRLALIVLGLCVSFFGIIGLLNKQYIKTAIWKKE
jgi:hypothetical protein